MTGRSRSRTIDDTLVEKRVYARSQHYYNGSITTDWWPSTVGAVGSRTYENTDDVVIDNFYTRRARGEIFNNPFTHQVLKQSMPNSAVFSMKEVNPSNALDYWWTRGSLVFGAAYPDKLEVLKNNFPALGDTRQQVIDLAVTASHANIDESAMLALATAAESKKSVSSLAAISRRALKIFKQVKRLDIKGLKGELSSRELQDRYMELRYALRPLVYDAVGVMKGLDSERRHIRQTYRGHADGSYSHTYPPIRIATGINKFYCDRCVKWDYKVSARAGVLCDVEVSNVEIWGADKVLESLWELAPWSFVADWFFNIGNTIAALTPNAGVKQLASWVTTKETLVTTYTYNNPKCIGSSWIPTVSLSGDTHVHTESVTTRAVDPAVSVFPTSNVRLDGYKLTDLGIMLSRMF